MRRLGGCLVDGSLPARNELLEDGISKHVRGPGQGAKSLDDVAMPRDFLNCRFGICEAFVVSYAGADRIPFH